jgi:hypothetical protein
LKVTKFGGGDERLVVEGMAVSPDLLAKLAPAWKPGLLPSPWGNEVADWCVQYYLNYGEAPGKQLESLFAKWRADNPGRDADAALIDKFIDGFGGRYKAKASTVNAGYLTDAAQTLFNKTRATRLQEELEGDLAANDVKKALARIKSFSEVAVGQSATVNVLQDFTVMKEVFTTKREPLVAYPGAAGDFFEDALERDAFVAVLAPEKRGKSYTLMDIAWRAMLERRRVAFFEVGDLSRNQLLRRFYVRAAKWPMKLPRKVLKYPKRIDPDAGEGQPRVAEFKELVFDKPLDMARAEKAMQEVMDKKVRSKEPYLKVSSHPTNSISVLGIKAILEDYARQGWVADVIIVDYADILAPINGRDETREQINLTWKTLRALSQEYHALVVTATQANAASYSSESMDMSNFSEDKRKFAHCTGMFGLNQNAQEKEEGVQRWNWLVLRESEFSVRRHLYVGQCLALANPCVCSAM